MEIRNNGGGLPAGLPPTEPGASAETARTISPDTSKLLAELAALAASHAGGSGAPGLPGGTGAPQIGGVTMDFSAEDMAAALLVLQGKTQDAQLRTAKEGLDAARLKADHANKKALDKIDTMIKKAAEAAAKQKALGILGWIGKIAGFIAAAVAVVVAACATAASFGAGAPMLAFAVIGLVGATISLASGLSQELGGPALELSSLFNKLGTWLMQNVLGLSEEDAAKAGKMFAGALGVMTGAVLVDPALAGDLVAGFAELVGADAGQSAIISMVFSVAFTITIGIVSAVASGGSSAAGSAVNVAGKVTTTGAQTASQVAKAVQTAEKTANTMVRAAKIAQGLAGVVQGATTVSTGALGIAKAADERDIEHARAGKKEIDALLVKLQQQMEENTEEMKKVIEQIMDGYNIVSAMFNDAANSRQQLAANIGARTATI